MSLAGACVAADDRLRERNLRVRHVVAYRLIDAQRAAGDRAVFGANDAAVDVIAGVGRRHVIGCEHEPVAERAVQQVDHHAARRGIRRRSAARVVRRS